MGESLQSELPESLNSLRRAQPQLKVPSNKPSITLSVCLILIHCLVNIGFDQRSTSTSPELD